MFRARITLGASRVRCGYCPDLYAHTSRFKARVEEVEGSLVLFRVKKGVAVVTPRSALAFFVIFENRHPVIAGEVVEIVENEKI